MTSRPAFDIDHFRLPVGGKSFDFDDLVSMMEIDLLLGRKTDFRERLQKALESAHYLGQKIDQPALRRGGRRRF
jgi:hypothetical protein